MSLRSFEVAPTYAGSELVYRVGEHSIERDPYASLAAPPARLLTAAVRAYLRDSDYIRDVVAPGEGLPVDADLEPGLLELSGDFTNPAEPAAVMALRIRVLTRPAGGAEREILLKAYTRRIPLSQRTAAAVVAAWNRALGEIMAGIPVGPETGPAAASFHQLTRTVATRRELSKGTGAFRV